MSKIIAYCPKWTKICLTLLLGGKEAGGMCLVGFVFHSFPEQGCAVLSFLHLFCVSVKHTKPGQSRRTSVLCSLPDEFIACSRHCLDTELFLTAVVLTDVSMQ